MSILKGSSAINRVIPHEYRPSFHTSELIIFMPWDGRCATMRHQLRTKSRCIKSSLYYPSSRFQKCHVFSCFPSQLGSADPSRPSNPWRPPVLHRLVPGTGERCRASPSSFPAAPASAASGTAGCRGLCPTRGEKTVVNPKHKYIYQ